MVDIFGKLSVENSSAISRLRAIRVRILCVYLRFHGDRFEPCFLMKKERGHC